MGGGHQQLRPLQEVVLLWVVLKQDMVVVCTRPVGEALEHLLMVLNGAFYKENKLIISPTYQAVVICYLLHVDFTAIIWFALSTLALVHQQC